MRPTASKNARLMLLMVILAFNYMDRFALGLILQDIKLDLALSDTQLGMMSGIAFALFYSVMGIPIAAWADRGNRVTIIALTTGLWSVAVALCGVAGSFLQLMLIRIGVAVGEAGCIPPAHSLIADYFSRDERPRAVAQYMLGMPLAMTVGFFAAGWLNELYGWRVTFIAIGLPGLVLATLAALMLKEPRRTDLEHMPKATSEGPPLPSTAAPDIKTVCVTLWANVTFRHLLLCFSVWLFFGYGMLLWTPAFFIRSHGLQTGDLGTWFALVYGVCGVVGVYVGGEVATRYAAGNERLQLIGCAVLFMVLPFVLACVFIAPNHYWAFAALSVASLGNMVKGPIFATIQTVVPPRMRATSIALVYLFANLIGMGLGPLGAGALSDALEPWFGNESLRWTLLMLCPGYLWAAWHLWCASRTVVPDMKSARMNAGGLPSAAIVRV